MSTLKVNDIEEATSGGGKIFPPRAWMNANGTGTVSIRADGNVSSISDYGTGSYGMNFSNSMTDANYSVVGMGGDHGNGSSQIKIITTGYFYGTPLQFNSSGVRIGATNNDALHLCAQVVR